MQDPVRVYSFPRWRITRWLADAGPSVPEDIRADLVANLFGTLPVFVGGVMNTLIVSAAIAVRQPTPLFLAWLILEITICIARMLVLITARQAALKRRKTPTDIYLLLGIAWSASVGYGVVISMASGDWVAATLAGSSAAAMVGGICFRNFSAPRLVATMIVLSLGPSVPGALLGGEPLLFVVFAQVPVYLAAMTLAAFKLNKMLVATMRAERENDYRAQHDALTGLSNRAGLAHAVNSRLAAGPDVALALLFLDLDGFKIVNDTFGHGGGDRLLKMVAERLSRMLRAVDVGARVGGDEFVVLAEALTPERAAAFGEALIASVANGYDLGEGVSASIGVSIGIAMAPEHGSDLTQLLAVADAALYEAKSGGKSRCCMASAITNLAALRRLQGPATDRFGAAA
ncbi:MAG TPA: GGDEF domain-containing protein [Pseudolabrys sp.]|jgi:diguanylate cyclase (GGDEF)-like protein